MNAKYGFANCVPTNLLARLQKYQTHLSSLGFLYHIRVYLFTVIDDLIPDGHFPSEACEVRKLQAYIYRQLSPGRL